jgi:hypothetical protein
MSGNKQKLCRQDHKALLISPKRITIKIHSRLATVVRVFSFFSSFTYFHFGNNCFVNPQAGDFGRYAYSSSYACISLRIETAIETDTLPE